MNHKPSSTEVEPLIYTETMKDAVKGGMPQGLADEISQKQVSLILKSDLASFIDLATKVGERPGTTMALVATSGCGFRDDGGNRVSSISMLGPDGGYSTAAAYDLVEELTVSILEDTVEHAKEMGFPQSVVAAAVHTELLKIIQEAMERAFPKISPDAIHAGSELGTATNGFESFLKKLLAEVDGPAKS